MHSLIVLTGKTLEEHRLSVINANVVIGHGISKRKAIMNMILQTREVVHANLAQKIKEAI